MRSTPLSSRRSISGGFIEHAQNTLSGQRSFPAIAQRLCGDESVNAGGRGTMQ